MIVALIAMTSLLNRNADSSPFTSSLSTDSGNSLGDSADYSSVLGQLYGSSSAISGGNSLPTVAGDAAVSFVPAPVVSGGEAPDLTELYTRCNPSVVSVSACLDSDTCTWGSGVLITSNGYLVTNNHVIEDAISVEITLSDDRTYNAALVGYDVQTDIAVLKIDAEGLTPVTFGDSDALQIGETVVAIGNPLGSGYCNIMTDGIISAIGREVSSNGYSMLLLQTNTAINEGNFGGPLFNAYG